MENDAGDSYKNNNNSQKHNTTSFRILFYISMSIHTSCTNAQVKWPQPVGGTCPESGDSSY